MILLAEKIVVLQRSVSDVFKFVTNMENYKKWFPGVVDIRSGNSLSHGQVGKQYIEILQFADGVMELTIEVKEFNENKSFVTEGDLDPLLPQMVMAFSDQDKDRCQFHLSYFSRSPELKENDEFILAIQDDLAGRIESAIQKLKSIVEE